MATPRPPQPARCGCRPRCRSPAPSADPDERVRGDRSHAGFARFARVFVGAADATTSAMTPTNILVPTDFSECAERALDYACALAAKLGAKVHVVNAIGATLPELPVALSDHM